MQGGSASNVRVRPKMLSRMLLDSTPTGLLADLWHDREMLVRGCEQPLVGWVCLRGSRPTNRC